MAPDTARRPATVSDAPDKAALRAWRLGRLRQELKARDYAGALLYDPINIRYACDVRNMQVWCLHNAARYVFVPTEGPVVLFDFHNCAHPTNFEDALKAGEGWVKRIGGLRANASRLSHAELDAAEAL